MWNSLLNQIDVHAADGGTYYAELTHTDSTWWRNDWLLWAAVGLLIIAVFFLPRYLNRKMHVGPMLGVMAFLGAAAVLPWALKGVLVEKRVSASADVSVVPMNIEILPGPYGSVILRWETPDPSLGAVVYGTSEKKLDHAIFSNDPLEKKSKHEVMISGLDEGKTYYIEIVSGGNHYGSESGPIKIDYPLK